MPLKNNNTDTIIEVLHEVRGMNGEVDALERLFANRRGRNPHAISRMRASISKLTCMLAPVLIQTTKEEVVNVQEDTE